MSFLVGVYCSLTSLILSHIPMQEKSSPIQVVIFLGLECPISQKYMHRLNEMSEFYGDKVEWIAYIPEKRSPSEIKTFADEYAARFKIVADANLTHTKRLKATVTPEAFLIRGEKVLYRGAIDNWFYELGRYRTETTEYYLRDALDAVVNGKEVMTAKTEAVGCFIQMPSEGHKHH